MTILQAEIIKYIEQYKKIIRAYYGRKKAKEANAYIYRMKITRKQLAQCDNAKLKKVCNAIVFDAKDFLRKRRIDLSCRFKNSRLKGLELLINNFEKELEVGVVVDYIKDAPNVRGREVWRNIINLIQYIILNKDFNSNFKSPEESAEIILEKGTDEEINYYFNLLGKSDVECYRKLKEKLNERS